jgi:esterase/lipase superfamily enzyme
MWVFNAQSAANAHLPLTDWEAGSYRLLWHGLDMGAAAAWPIAPANMKFADGSHAIILVHGFHNNPIKINAAYHQIASHLSQYGCKIQSTYGFWWPSLDGVAPWHYATDFDQCFKENRALANAVRMLKSSGYTKVSIIAHSMGSILTMEMMELIESGLVYRIVLHGGDADIMRFNAKEWYGAAIAGKIMGLASYYSKQDTTLGFWAHCYRPVNRAGSGAFPNEVPANYHSFDAVALDGGIVEHNSYKDSVGILRSTAHYLHTGA